MLNNNNAYRKKLKAALFSHNLKEKCSFLYLRSIYYLANLTATQLLRSLKPIRRRPRRFASSSIIGISCL